MFYYEHSHTSSFKRVARGVADTVLGRYSQVEGFSLPRTLAALQGTPVIEIAGPTDKGFRIINDVLPTKPAVSNLHKDPNHDFYMGKIDFAADSRHMPFADQSIGVVLASCVPRTDMKFIKDSSCRSAADEEYASYRGPDDGQIVTEQSYNLRINTI